MQMPPPQVGDDIYIDQIDVVHKTYLEGGLARITETWEENGRLFLSVAEVPDMSVAWDYLALQQTNLQSRYGASRAGQYMLAPGHPGETP